MYHNLAAREALPVLRPLDIKSSLYQIIKENIGKDLARI